MRRRSDRAAIEAEIDQIRSLGLGELRKRWSAMFGAPLSPGFTKDIIARAICHRIQEKAFGGLNREATRLLDSLACGPKPGEFNRRLKPGTVLFREHNGERHTVTIAHEGYIWQGTTYPSLSTIARAITGTAWNGPRFFGLRSRIKNGSEVESKRPSNTSRHSNGKFLRREAQR